MAEHRRIPEATAARLPLYLRVLSGMSEGRVATVSSEGLASAAGVNAAKVRKDLSFLGSFGTRGAGYDVEFLLAQIGRQLGLDRDWPVVIVGVGNLGRALANSEGFSSHGFRLSALVDVSPEIVGTKVAGIVVSAVDEIPSLVARRELAIGVITTPAPSAQDVVDRLVEAGVESILNFAPAVVDVPHGVRLRHVDLSSELQVMSFYQSRRNGAEPGGPARAHTAEAPATSAREPR